MCSDLEIHLQDVHVSAGDHFVVPHRLDPPYHLCMVRLSTVSPANELISRPPNELERKHGQTYPHAILWKPLLVGIFASCTVQTMRVPVWVVVNWFRLRPVTVNYL